VIDLTASSLLALPRRRGVGMAVQFMCPTCGGASITVPAGCVQEAEVICGSCGNVLSTWGKFKEKARLLICSREDGSGIISSDPLAM
jgi:transcription elongation factor Elf1